MKYYLNFALLFLLFLQSCHDENTPLNQLQFYWDQTSCGDPWDANNKDTDSEIKRAVEGYLKQEGVLGAKVISITNDGRLIVCLACSCTTGNRIYVTVPLEQKNKMLKLGFQEG